LAVSPQQPDVVYALIAADELDVTSANVEAYRLAPTSPEMAELLGKSGDDESLGVALGLDDLAFYNAILQVGNYDEIFTRNLEHHGHRRAGTLNASHEKGGLIWAPPFR